MRRLTFLEQGQRNKGKGRRLSLSQKTRILSGNRQTGFILHTDLRLLVVMVWKVFLKGPEDFVSTQ